MTKLTASLRSAALLVAVAGGMASLPAFANTTYTPAPGTDLPAIAALQPGAPAAAPMENPPTSEDMKHHVDARIQTLHDELKITPEQEEQWAPVAQTMRDNEANIGHLIETRHANANSMSAIDDLKSYQAIAQAHADGMAKFTEAFEPVYANLSDDQKKSADALFAHYQHPDAPGKKHHHTKAAKKAAPDATKPSNQ